jgi:uncharacterized hydrophobic protein (TIGR00271 family)
MADNQVTNNEPMDSHREEQEKVRRDQLFRRFKVFFGDLIGFIKELMSIRHDTDYEGTRQGIIRDIPFRGHTIYILICSIFIASIGLNLNSPAVIIGAMLIAPLMGPILGTGFAFGTNDSALLMRSLKNFGVMTGISLVTSTCYFLLTPLVEYQPELLARTKPTTLDIFVAIFGGIAGVVAGSRKEKSNVIPGVAIATALMPPLCTSGFGLATGNWAYFFGAFYLFLLNSIFICAATVVGVRYLKFPMKEYMNRGRERKVKLYMAIFMTIIILPSLWIFWGVLKESYFNSQANAFVATVIKSENSRIMNSRFIFDEDDPVIEIFMIGAEVPGDTLMAWRSQMSYFGLEKARLEIYGNGGMDQFDNEMASMQGRLRADIVEDLFSRSQEELMVKEKRIAQLEIQLSRTGLGNEKIGRLAKELKIQFEDMERISYSNAIETDFSEKIDTIPTFLVSWRRGMPSQEIIKNEKVLGDLMKVRLSLDTVRVIRY